VSIVLGISITFFYYTSLYSSESIAVSQTRESLETLSKAIDYVYALGPGAQTTVTIELPKNVVDSYINPKEIGFKIGLRGRVTDVYEITKASIAGSLPTTPGIHVININSTGAGVVIGSS